MKVNVIRKGKLSNLKVERVDAVTEPASQHRWAIIKQEPGPKRSASPTRKANRRRQAKLEGQLAWQVKARKVNDRDSVFGNIVHGPTTDNTGRDNTGRYVG